MRKFFFLILTQILFYVIAEPAICSDKDILFINKQKYFFGTVQRGDIVNHIFLLKNRGSEKIVISNIKKFPNCRLKASLPIIIMPDKTYFLEILLDTSGRQGVCKTALTLFCSKPHCFEKTLFISGKILSDIAISPQIISFNDIYKGTFDKKSLKFTSQNGFDQKINNISSSNKYITVVFNKKKSNSRTVFFDVILSPDTPLGYIDEFITVITNERLDAERLIKVTGKIVGDVKIEPDNLNFGLVNGQNTEKIVNIKNYNNGKSLTIRKIVSKNRGVITKLVTIKKGKEYMLLVKPVEPVSDKFSINDTLQIYTDSQLQPVIEINIAGNYSEDYIGTEY